MGEPKFDQPLSRSTVELLALARQGQEWAWDEIFRRYRPLLTRWAHRRLPLNARERYDTDDLVQETLLRAHQKLGSFEPRRDGSFLAYTRKILMRKILDEVRRRNRRPERVGIDAAVPDPSPGPLESAVKKDDYERYERALAKLRPSYRAAIVLRVEFKCQYDFIATELGLKTPEAARQVVKRAMLQLARVMNEKKAW